MLEVRDLKVRYGAVEAVRGVSLSICSGELVALIGSNGAGKSTFLKALCGVIRPVEGRINFDGNEIASLPAHRIVAQGMVMVPEGRRLFADQTIMDNLLIGGYSHRSEMGDTTLRRMAERFLDQFPILRERRDHLAGGLSGGQQQMLAISRGLMATPKLLLLDEPSLGLAPLLVRQIFSIIAELRQAGTTILLVEQMARQALRIADRAYILEQGKVVMHGAAQELMSRHDVARAYLGSQKEVIRSG